MEGSFGRQIDYAMLVKLYGPDSGKQGEAKKVDNHKAAIALHFIHYNFARIHKTLRVTSAMEAGVADHVWSPEEIAALSN